MCAENQARALMMRHHNLIKNRQQSLLKRAATEVGVEADNYWGNIQGKPYPSYVTTYDRSHASMS